MQVTYTVTDDHGDEIETRRVAIEDFERDTDEGGDLVDLVQGMLWGAPQAARAVSNRR
jgi:hypothetical protein